MPISKTLHPVSWLLEHAATIDLLFLRGSAKLPKVRISHVFTMTYLGTIGRETIGGVLRLFCPIHGFPSCLHPRHPPHGAAVTVNCPPALSGRAFLPSLSSHVYAFRVPEGPLACGSINCLYACFRLAAIVTQTHAYIRTHALLRRSNTPRLLP